MLGMETSTDPAASGPDIRAQRGLALVQAKGARIKHITGEMYLVPSQSSTGGYVVDLAANSCTCQDAETCDGRCKHLWALAYARGVVPMPAGEAAPEKRPTYKQNWPAYEAAQKEEKARVQLLLRGLCDGIVQPPQEKGRPRLLVADLVYSAAMKVYTTMSGRRATTDVRACAREGFIGHAPAHNSISKFIDDPAMKLLLTQLVEEAATPLCAIESAFAADATGFATSTYARWFDHKYGQEKKVQRWLKAHAMVGTATHVITAVKVTEGHENDSPHFKPLLATTVAKGFAPKEVSGDKAYLSNENLAAIEAVGAVALIPFKTNSSPTGNTEAWQRLFHFFSFNRKEFLAAYHKRSNVETVFSSVKRKFGGAVRSKLPAAQENEVLLKCLCHNLSMLVHAIHELGVEPQFWMPVPSPLTVSLSTEVAS
jgi:transposase